MVHSVLIADDHPILLSGLKALIDADPDFKVAGTATNGVSALENIRKLEPSIAILDLNMPLMTGLDVLNQISTMDLDTDVVVLAATASDDDIHRLVTAGAKGLVLKESAPQMLLQCLRVVATGDVWFAEEIPQIVSRQGEEKRLWRERLESLTEREIEVVRLANAGASNKEIAYELQLVEGTVKVHLNNIFRKLHVATRAELTSRTKGQLRPVAGRPH